MKYAFGKATSAAQKEAGTDTPGEYGYLPGPPPWTRYEMLIARRKWAAAQAKAETDETDETDD